jgi:hypothetical protein
MRDASDKVIEKIETHVSCSVTFSEYLALCEIMWKNIVERGRPQIMWENIVERGRPQIMWENIVERGRPQIMWKNIVQRGRPQWRICFAR